MEPLIVALALRLSVSEALLEAEVVAELESDGDTDCDGVTDRVMVSVSVSEGVSVAESVCDGDTLELVVSEGETEGVDVAVPSQMHWPLAGAPQDIRQHRARQGEIVGDTVTEGVADGTVGETDGVGLADGVVLGVMHMHVYGGTDRQLYKRVVSRRQRQRWEGPIVKREASQTRARACAAIITVLPAQALLKRARACAHSPVRVADARRARRRDSRGA